MRPSGTGKDGCVLKKEFVYKHSFPYMPEQMFPGVLSRGHTGTGNVKGTKAVIPYETKPSSSQTHKNSSEEQRQQVL